MEHSPEVEQALRDAVAAYGRRDVEAVLASISRAPGAVSIGTDPGEWLVGLDAIVGALQGDMVPGFESRIDEIAAYREGTVGWAAARGAFVIGEATIHVRMTVVLHQEDGVWKFVQQHASIGVPNDQIMHPMLQPAAAGA